MEHRVDFLLIGGWAAKLHGSPTVTADIEICHARDFGNLVRLADALSGLDVRLRGVGDDVPFTVDVRTLRAGDVFTLSSVAGDIDLLGSPAGIESLEVLMENADVLELDDLIRMKEAVGRPKDLIEVEVLEALRQEAHR